jgi:pyrimidine deaminase RibD-like protein
MDGGRVPFKVLPQEHAEQALLAQLPPPDLIGASAHVTLEPCTKRKTGKSCADLLIDKQIAVVHVGNTPTSAPWRGNASISMGSSLRISLATFETRHVETTRPSSPSFAGRRYGASAVQYQKRQAATWFG